MLSATQLREMANDYKESDPVLSGVIIALASARLVTETFGTDVAEVSLLQFCVRNSQMIADLADELERYNSGKLPFDPTLN